MASFSSCQQGMWAWQHVDGQPRARESEKIVFAEVLTLPKLHAEVVWIPYRYGRLQPYLVGRNAPFPALARAPRHGARARAVPREVRDRQTDRSSCLDCDGERSRGAVLIAQSHKFHKFGAGWLGRAGWPASNPSRDT